MTAKLYINNNFTCDVELTGVTPPEQTYTTTGPYVGDPTFERVPNKVIPGEVQFRGPIGHIAALGSPAAAFANVELELDTTARLSIQILHIDIMSGSVTAIVCGFHPPVPQPPSP
jgi:hypothetical protein